MADEPLVVVRAHCDALRRRDLAAALAVTLESL